MSLRDLKNLAPWQWESKVAQKKHAIGPKGLQDFEQVARVLQNDGKVQVSEKQVACSKRRRATKEADDTAAVPLKEDDHQTSDTAYPSLAAATPAVPVKKHRPSATAAAATPAAPRTANNFVSIGSNSHQKAPSRSNPTSTSRGNKLLSTPGGVTSPRFSLSLCPAAYTPGPMGVSLDCAVTAAATARGHVKDNAAAAAAALELTQNAEAAQAALGGLETYEKHLWTDKQQQLVATASKGEPTPSYSRTPAAAAAAATPTAACLLADVFSPSPCVPTPTPYATLRFKRLATPAAAAGGEGSVVKAVGFSGASSAAKPQAGSNSSGGMRRPAAVGTPLPRPQFSTPRMPPPANRRNNLQQQQQTPLGAARAAAGSGGSPSSSVMKRSPPSAQIPLNTTAMDLEPLPTLQVLLSAAGEEHSPGHHSSKGLVNAEGVVKPLLNPTGPNEISNVGPRVRVFSHMSPPGLSKAAKGCSGARDSEQSPPAAAAAAKPAAAAAAARKEQQSSGVCSSVQRCNSSSSSSARLPAKLRCKQGASNCRSAALLGQLGVGVDSPDSTSSGEPSPAAAAATSPPVQSLANVADAVTFEAKRPQQQYAGAVQSNRSGSSSAVTPSLAAAAAAAGSQMPGGSSSGSKMSNFTAGRMGLKRLWCHTHAAAMAAEAAEAAAAKGNTHDLAVALQGGTGGTPHQPADARLGVRSWSPDSQAVAMSAELLLAAAELDESAAAAQAVQVDERYEAVQDQTAGAAAGAAMVDVGGLAEQQQQQQQGDAQVVHPNPKAATAVTVEPKHLKPRCYNHHTAAEQQQQLCRRYSEHGGAAAEAAAGSADVARDASPPGDSLMLPPAAQLRLLLQQQQQQQPPAAAAASANTAAATATVSQPTWAVAIPTAAGTVVASAAQLTSAMAATSSGLQCMPYMLFQPASVAAAAGQQIGTQRQQQQQQCLSSLPLALQQLNVQRLHQQLGTMGYTPNSGCNNPIKTGGASSSTSNAGGSTARIAHVTPALHAAQAGLTRTSHTGELLQSTLPGVPGKHTQQPRQQHAASAAATNWDQASAQALWQQQQGMGGTVAATVRGRTPEPLVIKTADPAAAARTVSTQQQQQQQQVLASVSVELPSIEPLKVPTTLSDDEAWRLALANPQVIESESARARELLAGVPLPAAAAAPTGAAAAPSAAAALAALPTGGRKDHARPTQTPAGNSTAAGNATLAAAAATTCQGVWYRPSSNSMQDAGKQQVQMSPSNGRGFGVLRNANIINTQ